MTITVAIPSYNKEKYIGKCLKSIVAQRELIDKIIVVDNCSEDKTLEVVKSFSPYVEHVRNESNLGMSGNWNRCIDLCQTDWLMIFHADDVMVPGSMQAYRNITAKYPSVGMIYANSYSMKEDDESSKTVNPSHHKEFWKAGLDAMSCSASVCSAVMVRKSAYAKLGYFVNESLSSDVEMWHRIASKYDVAYINEPTVIYRVNHTSTGIDSLTRRKVKDIRKDWDQLNALMASHYPTKESRDAFLRDCKERAPGNFMAVIKANLRAGNYRNVYDALVLIIVTYRALIPLLKIVSGIVYNRIKRLLTQKHD